LPDLDLGRGLGMTNVPWLALDEWARYLRGSTLLLSLMLSPHTSYPPLEMAACGGTAITNTFESKTAAALAAISPRIIGVAPEPEALAEALARAAGEPDGAVEAAPGPPPVALPGTWDEAFRDVVPWLARAVRELCGRA
jgi:hypothetical protein